jgi:predicted nucleotidyltransferase
MNVDRCGEQKLSPVNISMNDRQRAFSIFSYARDVLAERLTEAVLNQNDQILDDAEGLSYTSDIDTIDVQLGAKLRTIHSLISSLPPVDPSETPYPKTESASEVTAAPDFALFAKQVAGAMPNRPVRR